MNPKKRTKNYLKELILNSEGISRTEIAEKAELDIRTATAYAEELCREGLAIEEKVNAPGRGRPAVLYKPDFKNLRFAGFAFRTDSLESILTDYNGNILKKDLLTMNIEGESKLSVVNRILDLVKSYVDFSQNGRLVAAGFSFTRWLRPPLSVNDIYHDLPDVISKIIRVPVYSELPINVCTYNVRNFHPDMRNIVVIHPLGNVLELGIQLDGTVPADAAKLEYEFQHTSVDVNGLKCYCGNNGCIGNYVTRAALLENYNANTGLACKYEELLEKFNNNEILAVTAFNAFAERLSVGIKKIVEVYHPEIISFLGVNDKIFQMINSKVKRDNVKVNLEIMPSAALSFAAAGMAACLSVKNFKINIS